MIELIIGRRRTDVFVCPDQKYPSIWRVLHPDGRLSDRLNLTRAKDAAIALARSRGLGRGEVIRWDTRETPPAASLAPENNFPHASRPGGAW